MGKQKYRVILPDQPTQTKVTRSFATSTATAAPSKPPDSRVKEARPAPSRESAPARIPAPAVAPTQPALARNSDSEQLAAQPSGAVSYGDRAELPAADTAARSAPEYRFWSSTDGQQVEAALIDHFADGRVLLQTRDGKTPTVPLSTFSPDDQAYVQRVRPSGTSVDSSSIRNKQATNVDEHRVWTSRKGQTAEAVLVSVETGRMTLRTRKGKCLTVPISEFSSEDQTFVSNWKKQRARSAATGSAHAHAHGQIVPRDDTNALIHNSEEALGLGRELMDWWSINADRMQTVPLSASGDNLVEMKAFFDTMQSGSETTSIMGCMQTARFKMNPHSNGNPMPLQNLKSEYAPRATWAHKNGRPAGFGYDAILYKEMATGQIHTIEDGTQSSALDFSKVGNEQEWLTLRVDIHDFLLATPMKPIAGFMGKFIKESAYIVSHDMYAQPIGQARPGTVAECLFGYSFLPCSAVKGPFGFGPGHFKSAIKQFRFSLLESGELEVTLAFLVSPRSQKVLNLFGFDPVYTMVHFLNAITFGLLRIKKIAHNALDKNFMTVHGQVHHNFLNGMEGFWANQQWVPGWQPGAY